MSNVYEWSVVDGVPGSTGYKDWENFTVAIGRWWNISGLL